MSRATLLLALLLTAFGCAGPRESGAGRPIVATAEATRGAEPATEARLDHTVPAQFAVQDDGSARVSVEEAPADPAPSGPDTFEAEQARPAPVAEPSQAPAPPAPSPGPDMDSLLGRAMGGSAGTGSGHSARASVRSQGPSMAPARPARGRVAAARPAARDPMPTSRTKAPAGARRAAADRAAEPAARVPPQERARNSEMADETQRPGLATTFGEQRQSVTHRVYFERNTPEPFAVVTMHYDDQAGVQRMLGHGLARGEPLGPVSMGPVGDVTVEIIDEVGRPLPAYRIGDRIVIVGQEGQRYLFRLVNRTVRNIEVVASVDGLDVVTGRPASTTFRGYILAAHGSLVIEGFRTSIADVAVFRFGGVADSYAARSTGSARNVGILGVALFQQRVPVGWEDREVDLRENAEAYPADHYARPQ